MYSHWWHCFLYGFIHERDTAKHKSIELGILSVLLYMQHFREFMLLSLLFTFTVSLHFSPFLLCILYISFLLFLYYYLFITVTFLCALSIQLWGFSGQRSVFLFIFFLPASLTEGVMRALGFSARIPAITSRGFPPQLQKQHVTA